MNKKENLEDICSNGNNVKVKVKLTLEQVTKAQRWSRDIAVLFL
jgi:hypothetical protein